VLARETADSIITFTCIDSGVVLCDTRTVEVATSVTVFPFTRFSSKIVTCYTSHGWTPVGLLASSYTGSIICIGDISTIKIANSIVNTTPINGGVAIGDTSALGTADSIVTNTSSSSSVAVGDTSAIETASGSSHPPVLLCPPQAASLFVRF
jgi:hypothetical protein